jgi:hypothetical protein
MKWIKERDLLIAQTMAFVQSVAGKKATAETREVLQEVLIEPILIGSTLVGEIAEEKRPAETVQSLRTGTVQTTRPSPVRVSDIRQEIRGRVAAFRAHQELFHRERDEYYNSVVTRLRASADHAPKTPDDHLPKP